jgi:UDP-GlcNAc:undecaprenyl-phosphate/decaprenyl-phosphate GlcNAc-1-phosphate transferase
MYYILIVLVSFIVSYGLKLWFTRFKKFDAINHRSIHNTKATKTGGIAIFITLFIFTFFYYLNQVQIFDFSLLIPLGIMFIVGVYDDFYNADFKLKFFLQIIVAKILIDQGLVIDNFHGVFGLNEIPRLASQVFTIFVFLVIVNAFNFIDGIDGLAITETIKVILLVELFSNESTPFLSLCLIIIFSLLPLYYFNFKKENKVFLGDAGSLFLGTIISILLFYVLGPDYKFKPEFQVNKAVFSMGLIIYPLFDLLRVFIIRLSHKKSPFLPDQNHIHHLLINSGLSHFSSLLIIESCSLFILLLYLFT